MNGDFADVIGPETTVRGHIEGAAPLLVRGRVEGSIRLDGHLMIGAGAHVAAEIEAQVVTVEGTVEGTIVASERTILRDGCRVEATVRTPGLAVEDGAHMLGQIEMDVELPEGVSVPRGRA